MDQNDVKAVLKIMGHNWPAGENKPKKKKKKDKNWGTKALEELVVSIGKEEDELVSWWRRPYCLETVRKHLKPTSVFPAKAPMFFETYDEEERLWGFAERMESIMYKANAGVVKNRNTRKTTSRLTRKSTHVTKTKNPKSLKGKSGKKKT